MWTPVVYTGTDTQTPGLVGYNLYSSDPALQNMVQLSSAGWHQELLAQGEVLGSETTLKLAEQANRHPPELYTRSVAGERIDVVRFPPAWHDMMAITRRHGIANRSFADTRPGSWLACAASQYMHSQIETGTIFPSNMTQACIPVLQHESPLFDQLAPKLYSMEHDARDIPLAYKTAITVGMGLTVMQGKSAYSAKNNQNGIAACAVGMTGRGREYRLTGHKWVFSAPMCDAHLVLAQSAGGYSCFFVPRWCQDGRKNTVFIQRLYDRVGNRSNSSSEVVFDDALGILVGEEGKGVAMMIAMVNCIRVNCTLASAGMLRQAFSQALYYARHHNPLC